MKTIYQPKGKAGEYAKYAVNFYNGCSNECEYCYLKRGAMAKTLGGNAPTLQKKYKDENDAFTKFVDDVDKNIEELRKHGLFFTFTSDPLLKETRALNIDAVVYATEWGKVPCTLLTKRAEADFLIDFIDPELRHLVAVGFTLTGHDELEPNASKNFERIEAMEELHAAGLRTWASIEPIINVEDSLEMMDAVADCCDLFKVGLRSGVKKEYYTNSELFDMYESMEYICDHYKVPIYLKDSFVERLGLDRNALCEPFVGADYSMFTNK